MCYLSQRGAAYPKPRCSRIEIVYRLTLVAALLLLNLPRPAQAVTSLVGDPDGFGISPTTGLVAANGGPADSDGDGIIEDGEYLPDWNQNGNVAIGSNDYFDFRSSDEISATDGAQWTDYSVEGGGVADGAQFHFQFPVPSSAAGDHGTNHFINFVFGDYDVNPTSIDIDGTTVTLTTQTSGQDGLVQAAFAEVPWAEMEDGEVIITVHAPNEPYLTFDYALLDLFRLADADGDGIPGSLDNCPGVPNLDQADGDDDGVGDLCDLCPDIADPEQFDADADGTGDICDPCPLSAGAEGDDADEDGFCAPIDCDDQDAETHPAAEPGCDPLVDRNCDGIDDLSQNDCGDDDDSAADDDDSATDDDDSAADDDDSDDAGDDGNDDGLWGNGCSCFSDDDNEGGSNWALLLPLLALGRRRRSGQYLAR